MKTYNWEIMYRDNDGCVRHIQGTDIPQMIETALKHDAMAMALQRLDEVTPPPAAKKSK